MRRIKEYILLTAVTLLISLCGYGSAFAAELQIGDQVPDFTLKSLEGEEVTLSDYFGDTVILEWISPDCPTVNRLHRDKTMKELREQSVPFGMKWFAINSTHYMTAAKSKFWVDKMKVKVPFLLDPEGTAGKAFGAKTTPHIFIIKDGKLVYSGAVDDDPKGENPRSKRYSYVERAIRSLHNNIAIEDSRTRPYGSTVKYKK